MWQIAYSLIFRVYSRNYGHECKVDLILTVGPLKDLMNRLNREAIDRVSSYWKASLATEWNWQRKFTNWVQDLKVAEMWMCRMIVKIVTEIADDLYNLHTLSFIVSVGTVRESLQLIDVLDEDENTWQPPNLFIDLKINFIFTIIKFCFRVPKLQVASKMKLGDSIQYACSKCSTRGFNCLKSTNETVTLPYWQKLFTIL